MGERPNRSRLIPGVFPGNSLGSLAGEERAPARRNDQIRTTMITACMIDSREPAWVQKLAFGGAPTAVATLDYGDLHVLTDDGCTLLIERKTPEDFLNSLRDERLLPQLVRLVSSRIGDPKNGDPVTTWPYLMITGELQRGPGGKVVTGDRGTTGWDWSAIQGALLTIQEMGCFVVFCGGDVDFESAVLRLANRKRDPDFRLLPPRTPTILGHGAALLASLPGIGTERVMEILRWAGNNPAHAIAGITDLEADVPGLPKATQKRIRKTLGLKDAQELSLWVNSQGDDILEVIEQAEKQ